MVERGRVSLVLTTHTRVAVPIGTPTGEDPDPPFPLAVPVIDKGDTTPTPPPAEAPAPDNASSSFPGRVQNAPHPTRVSPPPLLASSLFCSFRGFVMMMLERWTLPSSETLSR
jgi:hypothetical protein